MIENDKGNKLFAVQTERNMEIAKRVQDMLPSVCPSFDLCKLIPEGKFLLSIYVWMKRWTTDGRGNYKDTQRALKPRTSSTIRYDNDIPAPTAGEILADLKETDGIWCPSIHSSAYRGWLASCRTIDVNKQHKCAGSWIKETGRTPVEALMRLWLKINKE